LPNLIKYLRKAGDIEDVLKGSFLGFNPVPLATLRGDLAYPYLLICSLWSADGLIGMGEGVFLSFLPRP
jgi:hypothetical protein